MVNTREYIESGKLESYVLGICDPEEAMEVERMAADYEEIRVAIDVFSESLEKYAQAHAIEPDPIIKPFLMATIDYSERIQNGEPVTFPPTLHEDSKISDYADWLNRPDLQIPPDFADVHARIIGYTPEVITAIVWIKEMAPQEVHDHEFEKFLIVEGTCLITINEDAHKLGPGDFLAIPLHKNHFVTVTSDIPCKVVLQRVAA